MRLCKSILQMYYLSFFKFIIQLYSQKLLRIVKFLKLQQFLLSGQCNVYISSHPVVNIIQKERNEILMEIPCLLNQNQVPAALSFQTLPTVNKKLMKLVTSQL